MRLDQPNLGPKPKPETTGTQDKDFTEAVSNAVSQEVVRSLIDQRIEQKKTQLLWHVQDLLDQLKKDFSMGDTVMCLQIAIAMLHKLQPELRTPYEIVQAAAIKFVEDGVELIYEHGNGGLNDLNENFEMGPLVMDEGLREVLPREEIFRCLNRHAALDWGVVSDSIADYNKRAIAGKEGPVLSRYEMKEGPDLVIITDLGVGKSVTSINRIDRLGPIADILFKPR